MGFYKVINEPSPEIKTQEPEYAKPIEGEGFLGKIGRNIESGLTKGAGLAASIPGAALKFGESLMGHAEQARNKMVENALKPGNEANLYGSDPELTRKGLEEYKKNPTQTPALTPGIEKAEQSVQDFYTSKVPRDKDFYKPRDWWEKTGQNLLEAIPVHFALGGSLGGLRSSLSSIASGEVGAETAKYLGGGETAQGLAKFLTPSFLKARNIKNVKDYFNPIKDKLYDEAEKSAGNLSIKYPSLKNRLEKLWSTEHAGAFQGGSNNKKNLALIESRFKGDDIKLKDLVKTKQQLNRLVYQENKNPKYYEKLLSDTNKAIESAKKVSPEFVSSLREADKVSQVLNKSERVTSYFKDIYENAKGPQDIALKAIFGPPSKTQVALLGKLPMKALDYYAHSIAAAANDNKPLFLKEVKKLTHELKKVDSKDIKTEKPTSGFYKVV